MQRAGRRAKKDNTNKAKSSKGAANANQNVVNINLGDLMEKHSAAAAAPKKRVAVSSADGEPARKQPKITDQQMDRLKRLKQEYTQLTRSTDMRMIPEGCRDVPDRLLHPRTPEQVRELADYLQSCIRNIGLRSVQGIRPAASGIRAAPSAAAAAVPSIPGVTGPTVPTTPFYQLPAAPLTQEEKYLKEELPAIIAYLQQLEQRLREADEKKDMAEAIKGFKAYEQIAKDLPALVSMSTSNEEVQELQQQARAAFEGLKQALDAALGLPEEPAGPEEELSIEKLKEILREALKDFESFNIQLDRALSNPVVDASAVGAGIEQMLDNTDEGKNFWVQTTKALTTPTNDPEIQSLQNQVKEAEAQFKVLMQTAMGADFSTIVPDTPPPGTQPLQPDTPLKPELAAAIKRFEDDLQVYKSTVDSLRETPSIDRLNKANEQFNSLQLELSAEPLSSNAAQERQEVRDLGYKLTVQLERYQKPYSPDDYGKVFVHQINSREDHKDRRNTFAKVVSVDPTDGFLRVVRPIIKQGVVAESKPHKVSPRNVITSDAAAYEAYEQRLQNEIATPPPKQPPPGNNSSKPPWSPGGGSGGLFGPPPPVPKPPLPKPPGGFPSGGGPKKPDPAPGESP